MLEFFGEIEKKSKERAMQLSYSSDGALLACLAADKTLEFFRMHTNKEIKKKRKKRKNKHRQQKDKIDSDEQVQGSVSSLSFHSNKLMLNNNRVA